MRQIPRLFVPDALAAGQLLSLDGAPAHYLATVLRLEPEAELRLLDDRTGEYRARILTVAKRRVSLAVEAMVRAREETLDLWLIAAPLKRQRFEWLVEKACEQGVRHIQPVRTVRTNAERLNPDRLRAHMIEAAEQCGRTALPTLGALTSLPDLLANWDSGRMLIFADEEGGAAMARLAPALPAAILIGPEGGFALSERAAILACVATRRLSLGPNILRADTAAVAAVAQFHAILAAG